MCRIFEDDFFIGRFNTSWYCRIYTIIAVSNGDVRIRILPTFAMATSSFWRDDGNKTLIKIICRFEDMEAFLHPDKRNMMMEQDDGR